VEQTTSVAAPITPSSTPVDAGTPAPVTPVTPAPVTPPADAVVMEKGGWLDEITFANVGMIIIFTVAMATVIYCSRQQVLIARKAAENNRKDIDEIKANVQSAMGANYENQT
jgi:hypothetical protein